MAFKQITESASAYRHLEKMTVAELLQTINKEDKTVPGAIEMVIPQIEILIHAIVDRMLGGGRLFYLGAGTSGRLGVLDASECPPTFGVPYGLVVGVIAGGEKALIQAIESVEDDTEQGWHDLLKYDISESDTVIGIAASGTTPYVLGALEKCRENNILTASICCNPESPISAIAEHPVEIVVGPEFVSGSTRMKSGTAQKLVLNMISTSVMIQLGRVEDNKMVNMQLSNEKLLERGIKMLMEKSDIKDYETAKSLLARHGSVKKAIERNHS